MSVTLIRGNALALPLADESVDLVVTSPPYFGLRSYRDGGEHYAGQVGDESTPAKFIDALIAATREMVRVLKPSGSIFVNLGDKYSGGRSGPQGATGQRSDRAQAVTYGVNVRDIVTDIPNKSLMGLPWRYALRCIDDLGLILRAEIVWSKPNGLPESVTDRVRRSHEQWFHLVRRPHYFSAVGEVRTPQASQNGLTWEERKALGQASRHGDTGGGASAGASGSKAGHPLGSLPGSVWTIATEPLKVPEHVGVDHFAAFPTEWPLRLIKGWCPNGGTVLDPFGGTGTTALVADALGRHGISVDMSGDYCRLAAWRTSDPKQRAKAARRDYTPPAEQTEGQMALLDEEAS